MKNTFPRHLHHFTLTESARKKEQLRRLEGLWNSWGYQPSLIPLLDFAKHYEKILDSEDLRNRYRIIDREGHMLILRSDITLFLARKIAMHMASSGPLPLRFYYCEDVLKESYDYSITSSDVVQCGIELMGLSERDGDPEVLLLLCDSLKTYGKGPFALHLGSQKLLHTLAHNCSVDCNHLLSLVRSRSFAALTELFQAESTKRTEVLLELFRFIGSPDSFRAFCAKIQKHCYQDEWNHLCYLLSLTDLLDELKIDIDIRIDLSELAERNYYTGIVFAVYADYLERPLAVGGRYDAMMKNFGVEMAAAGFSMYPFKELESTELPAVQHAQGATFIERYYDAQDKRKEGCPVVL